MKRSIFFLSFLCLLIPLVDAITLTDEALDIKAKEISEQLRCPVCRGVPIGESPSGLEKDMMAAVREQLKEGKSEEQILSYFVDHYGEWILLEPKPHGLNLMIWILPAAVLLAGGGILTFSVSKWTKKA